MNITAWDKKETLYTIYTKEDMKPPCLFSCFVAVGMSGIKLAFPDNPPPPPPPQLVEMTGLDCVLASVT